MTIVVVLDDYYDVSSVVRHNAKHLRMTTTKTKMTNLNVDVDDGDDGDDDNFHLHHFQKKMMTMKHKYHQTKKVRSDDDAVGDSSSLATISMSYSLLLWWL